MDEAKELEALQGIYSDTYKEVWGVRPRDIPAEKWGNVEWLNREIDELYALCD